MVRAGGWAGVFVVVEGPEDEGFWRAHLRVGAEAIVVSEGVRNLQDCMRALPQALDGTVCAIADQDFRSFLPADPFTGCQAVFFYDEGFLETFLLNTPAFRKLLGLRAEGARLAAFLATFRPHTVYSRLRHVGSVFGRLRILNELHRWGLCFEKIYSVFKYVDSKTWQLDEVRLYGDIATSIGWSTEALESCCDRIGKRGELRLVHGHDALRILAIGLRESLGSMNVGARTLCAELRLAFESASLERKRLTLELKAWAGQRTLI